MRGQWIFVIIILLKIITEIINYLTLGLPSDKAWEKVPPHPSLLYLLSFTQFLDASGIMIMLFDLIDTQQLSQDSLILLFDMTSDYTKYIKKGLS